MQNKLSNLVSFDQGVAKERKLVFWLKQLNNNMEDYDIQKKDKIIFSIGLVVSVVVIFFTILLYYKYILFNRPTSMPVSDESRATQPQKVINDSDFKQKDIKILNGSGVPGVAGKLLIKLKDVGYINLSAGNYDIVVTGNILFAPEENLEFVKDLEVAGFSKFKFEKSESIRVVIGK